MHWPYSVLKTEQWRAPNKMDVNAIVIIKTWHNDISGTVVASFNNTSEELQLSVSLNGTRSDYLTQFFASQELESRGNESRFDVQNLVLAKVLDLELLAFELVSFEVNCSLFIDWTLYTILF